jgi:hypothetical protein
MDLAVPQYISRVGVYTGQMFLLCFVTSVYYNFSIVSSLALLATYFMTIIHWYKLRHTGIIKDLDRAAILNLVVSFYYTGITKFCPMCQRAWITTMAINIIVYVINNHIFYCQTNANRGQIILKDPPEGRDPQICLSIMKPGCYSYFSLAYTMPNTRERELCYYYNSYVHCLFLHVISGTVSVYCAIIMTPENY